MTPHADAEPVVPSLCTASPFSDCCPRCVAPALIKPVHQFQRAGEIRSVYQCPACGSSWRTARSLAWLGGDYVGGEVAA